MTVLAVLAFLIQLGLAIHCLKTGRGGTWLSIILFVPLLGSVLYVITQLIPDLKGDPRARKAFKDVAQALDPTAELPF